MVNDYGDLRKKPVEFDLSAGKTYTDDDFQQRAEFPDELLVKEQRIMLLDEIERAHKTVEIVLSNGDKISGYLQGETIGGTYTVSGQSEGKPSEPMSFSADQVVSVEIK